MKMHMTDADVMYDFYNVVNGEGTIRVHDIRVWQTTIMAAAKDLIFEFVMLFYPTCTHVVVKR